MENKIKQRLADLEMTQWDLARATGLQPSTISLIINGRNTNPTLETMRKIASALQCTIPQLWPTEEVKK